MDNNSSTTLRDLFFESVSDAVAGFLAEVDASNEKKRLKKKLASEVPKLDWVSTWRTTSDMIGFILDQPIGELLLTALNRYRKLQELANPRQYPPDREIRISMDCRKLSFTHSPRLIFIHNGVKKAELVFMVKLTIHLELLQLVVQAGRITRIELGECRGSGEILLENHSIVKRELGELRLPASLDLGEGWKISTGEPSLEVQTIEKSMDAEKHDIEQKISDKQPRGCFRRLFLLLFLLFLAAGAMWIWRYGMNLNELPRFFDRFISQGRQGIPSNPSSQSHTYQRNDRMPDSYQTAPATQPPISSMPHGSPPPSAKNTYMLVIDVSPPDAKIHVEGPGYTGPYNKPMRLPPGTYRIQATAPGGAVRYDKIRIDNRDVRKKITVGGFH